jgi:[ribosomal protein S5]-alanine N-acetyltransferase
MKAPERIETARLFLHRPTRDDLRAIFDRYASDPEVTRYLAWPRHQSIIDTEFFLKFSDAEWNHASVGPYLVRSRADQMLLGSTGLALESPDSASTGYVFARDSWGRGYASESLRAMIDLARDLGLRRLYALCHVQHNPSARVLEKARFNREKLLPKHILFPNLGSNEPSDVFSYAIAFESGGLPGGIAGR